MALATRQHEILIHQDGAKTAYEVIGNYNDETEPIVLVGGLSLLRGDWEPLSSKLAVDRQVLIFDNRGIGDSTFSTAGDEKLTIELMARDLFNLLVFLGWKTISICGYSMGGLITQQLLLLPYIDNNSTPLPFRITHVILAATLTGPKNKEQGFVMRPPPPLNRERTWEEQRELRRPMLEASLDPRWLDDPANAGKFEELLTRMSSGSRPLGTIMRQARAIDEVKLEEHYSKLPMDHRVLVIHGKLDNIVPFSYSADILKFIPWAKMVKVGTKPGQIESLNFGHHWFAYFGIDVWHKVITQFLNTPSAADHARL